MTLHDQKQFDEMVAAQIEAGAAPVKAKAKRKAPATAVAAPATPVRARVPAEPRRQCDCTASRYDLINGS